MGVEAVIHWHIVCHHKMKCFVRQCHQRIRLIQSLTFADGKCLSCVTACVQDCKIIINPVCLNPEDKLISIIMGSLKDLYDPLFDWIMTEIIHFSQQFAADITNTFSGLISSNFMTLLLLMFTMM